MNCIIIKSATSVVKTINRAGKPALHFNEQCAAIETGDDFPKPFKLTLGENEKPYPPGRYTLDIASLTVGDFDSLQVGRNIKLIPLTASVLAANAVGK
jgi:hypothetical protein